MNQIFAPLQGTGIVSMSNGLVHILQREPRRGKRRENEVDMRVGGVSGTSSLLLSPHLTLSHSDPLSSSLFGSPSIRFLPCELPSLCTDILTQLPFHSLTGTNSDDWHKTRRESRFPPPPLRLITFISPPHTHTLDTWWRWPFCNPTSHTTQFLTNRFITLNDSSQLNDTDGGVRNGASRASVWLLTAGTLTGKKKTQHSIKWSWRCFKTLPIMSTLASGADTHKTDTFLFVETLAIKLSHSSAQCDTAGCSLFVVVLER